MSSPVVDLRGKAILVTGGSMGIGHATAEACLRAGARVTIAARTQATVHEAVARLGRSRPGDVQGVCCDVADGDAVEEAVATSERSFGRIDGLVHAAAVLGPIGTVTEVDPEEWLETLRVNLFGTFLVVRHAARRMIVGGGGRIVLFSGGGASGPFPNYTSYACSKVAVVRFCETVAAELAPSGVEVNCLAPGFVATRMHDQTLSAGDRAGPEYLEATKSQLASGGVPPERAAEVAAFLVSDGAAGITGRFAAAAYDDVVSWPGHLPELDRSDLFTLRRVVPPDKGLKWQ